MKIAFKSTEFDDGKRDFYIGAVDQPHIKVTEEFIIMMGSTYEKMRDNPEEVAALFLAVSTMVVNSIIENNKGK